MSDKNAVVEIVKSHAEAETKACPEHCWVAAMSAGNWRRHSNDLIVK